MQAQADDAETVIHFAVSRPSVEVHLVPPPKGLFEAPLRARIFDSWFDTYRGVIILMRVMEAKIRKGQ